MKIKYFVSSYYCLILSTMMMMFYASRYFSSQLFLIPGESAASSRRSSVQPGPGRASADLETQPLERESQPGPGHQHEGLTSQGGWPALTNQRAGLSHADHSELEKLFSQIVLPPLAFLSVTSRTLEQHWVGAKAPKKSSKIIAKQNTKTPYNIKFYVHFFCLLLYLTRSLVICLSSHC